MGELVHLVGLLLYRVSLDQSASTKAGVHSWMGKLVHLGGMSLYRISLD